MDEVATTPPGDIGVTYRRWADTGVKDSSATYYAWAHSIASDGEVLELLAELPGRKRQPNLVFGAARYLGAAPGPYRQFRSWLMEHWTDTRQVVLARSTQTNEAARCAVLLPALANLEGPLALIEVGASAGLCLYPDRYSYRYETAGRIASLDPGDGPGDVVIDCRFSGTMANGRPVQPPIRLPHIASRIGIDLNPLDAADPDTERWLDALVWPEHEERRLRLRRALKIARADPPHMVRGDLLEHIDDLIADVPVGTRPVVVHSAVLAYLGASAREQFAQHMLERKDVTWIANEGAPVLPSVIAGTSSPDPERFVVSVDGIARGFADQHGRSYEALGA